MTNRCRDCGTIDSLTQGLCTDCFIEYAKDWEYDGSEAYVVEYNRYDSFNELPYRGW